MLPWTPLASRLSCTKDGCNWTPLASVKTTSTKDDVGGFLAVTVTGGCYGSGSNHMRVEDDGWLIWTPLVSSIAGNNGSLSKTGDNGEGGGRARTDLSHLLPCSGQRMSKRENEHGLKLKE
jgi:hypothetical protein